jgi:hypothetical protein
MFPITVYHGSDTEIPSPDERPLYVTPDPAYGYIQKSKLVYEAIFYPKQPYWTDNQNMIESLRHRPDDIQMLKDMGYDAVVYAKPGEPTVGGSGWGSDRAQYLCLSPAVLSNWKPIAIAPSQLELPSRTYIDVVGPLYHGTDAVFHRYESFDDIGIHFGTLRAAADRLKKTGREQHVTISLITPSPTDLMRATHAQKKYSASFLDLTMDLLLRKIKHPKTDLYDTLSLLPEHELLDVAQEYKKKPDIPDYEASVKRGQNPPFYKVECAGKTLLETTSAEYAVRFSEFAQAHLTKKSFLLISNPVTLPDLGTWSLEDVLRHVGGTPEHLKKISEAVSVEEKRAVVHDAMKSAGFDGIKYLNAVEDAGHYSYIALSPAQVVTLSPPLPRMQDTPGIMQQLRRRMG